MKRFACGDVIPGCDAEFHGSQDDILGEVAVHARDDHGLTEVTPELVHTVVVAMHPA